MRPVADGQAPLQSVPPALPVPARRWWVLRHPVLVVVLVAAAVRLWVLDGLPLILTNDSVGYITWAREFLDGRPSTIPPLRTPGYPLFLAAVFALFGVGPSGVLVAQHVAGVGTAAIAAGITRRRHGPGWGLAAGLFLALSPSVMCWESYALTETLTIFLLIASLALALVPRGGAVMGLSLGLLLGSACLTRPSMAVVALALGLGWWWRTASASNRGLGGALALAAGLAVTTGPWLVHNARRGIYGLAAGERIALWYGAESAGVLDDAYPLPPKMAEARERLRSVPRSEEAAFRFLEQTNAWHDRQIESVLGAWTRASILSRPWPYARGVLRVLAADLGVLPNDLRWFVRRLSVDGRSRGQVAGNMQLSPGTAVPGFDMPAGRGAAAQAAAWTARNGVRGLPQVPLLLGAIFAAVGMLGRRDWGGAIIVAGTGAFFMIHPVMLLPSARLAVPAWACWVILLPDGAATAARWIRACREARRSRAAG